MAGHYQNTVEDQTTGKPVNNATIKVYEDGATISGNAVTTGTLATIYSDDGVTVIDQSASPLTTSSNGEFDFYTEETRVVIAILLNGDGKAVWNDVDILGGSVSSDVTALATRVSAVEVITEDQGIVDLAGLAVTDSNIIVGDGTNWVAESGATARTSLGLAIGTDVQAYDAGLADIAGLAVTDGNVIVGDGANWVAESGATARTSLGAAGTGDANTFTGLNTFSAGANITPAAAPATNAVGYLGSPQMSDQDDYTLVMGDAGKHYYHVSATPHTLTIPANASVAFPIGTVIAIVNENGGGAVTLAITTDTLRWTDQTGSRTIAADGTATLLKVTATVWRLTGDGIT